MNRVNKTKRSQKKTKQSQKLIFAFDRNPPPTDELQRKKHSGFLACQEQNNFGLPVSNYEKTFGIPMELF